MAIKYQHVTRMFDRLDKIAEERYGTADRKTVMFVIEQNPGIELHPILLPPGLTIQLPDIPQEKTGPQLVRQIFLWE